MSSFFSTFRSSFDSARRTTGNALVISVIAVAVTSLAVIGVGKLITDSTRNNRAAENSDAAYFAMEGLMETAIYDASGHGAGHEVAPESNADHYNSASFQDGRGSSEWSLEDRAIFVDPTATLAEDGYDGSDYPATYAGYMVVPSPRHGDDTEDQSWNMLAPDRDATIPLYVDNTSCSRSDADCE